MAFTLPKDARDALDWDWSRFKPFYDDLEARKLDASTLDSWMTDWTAIGALEREVGVRIRVALDLHSDDPVKEKRYTDFLEKVDNPASTANQKLKEKLIASGLTPDNFSIPLRNMKAEAALFREKNIPLFIEHEKTALEYDKIVGSRMVKWEGKDYTLTQIVGELSGAPRDVREKGWKLAMAKSMEDAGQIDDVWVRLMGIRDKIAKNAGEKDFRDYAWKQRLRFDYSPKDCESFGDAIEKAVVPAAKRVYDRRAKRLGVSSLRPWDVSVDVMRSTDINIDCFGRPALRPFKTVDELQQKAGIIFNKVDPRLKKYFDLMNNEKLYDLPNYKGKAPGAYCTGLDYSRRPFVLLNAAGTPGDVDTILHESGHAFHTFQCYNNPDLKYLQLWDYPSEFAEVASMGMELLGSPFITKDQGGFYTEEEAARARIMHLEQFIIFWPFMACVDLFQHWAYESGKGNIPAECDKEWGRLWDRFVVGVDWSGLEKEKCRGWQRKLHPFHYPFYYVEYGFAQLGAVQVFANSLKNRKTGVDGYLHGLSLGYSVTLPELFKAAGGHFGFDVATLKEATDVLENEIAKEEKKL